MDTAERDMIYHFLHKEPSEEEIPYKRGVCRIWPIDEFDWYMDPAPNEGAGIFSIIPEREEKEKTKVPPSNFIDMITKKLKDLDIGKAKKHRKGSRAYIANHSGLQKFRKGYQERCGRVKK